MAFEPNVVPGFANRIVARWVSAAAVHFEETGKFFPRGTSQGSRFETRFSRLRRNPRRAGISWFLVEAKAQGRSIRR